MAAAGVGGAIIGGTGWRGATVLGTFFVSSSALSRMGRASNIVAKGSQRDARQVLSNGGVAAAIALVAGSVGQDRALTYLTGALAAAAADTRATEIGSTSSRRPRTLIRRQNVQQGESGGVTTRGMAGALGGSALVSGVHMLLMSRPRARHGVGCFIAGVGGSVEDSIIGELIQERRWCPDCQLPTEARVHHCGTATVHVGGVRGMDNDAVNLCCTIAGAGIAAVLTVGKGSARTGSQSGTI